MNQHFYEITRSGSHADRAFCGKRGLVKPAKSPRLAATAVANALTVATNDFLIDRVDLNRSWGTLLKLITGFLLSTLFFSIPGSSQVRDKQSMEKELQEIARVATAMVDGDVCQRIMTGRALKKMFVLDPKDPWAGSDNFDVNAEPFIQTKKLLMRLARLVSYPVDCNLWMPFKGEPGKIQVLIRNKYEMTQFWKWGALYSDAAQAMMEVLSTGRPQTVSQKDDFVSVLTPVYNSLGDVVALVEVVSRVHFNSQENVQ